MNPNRIKDMPDCERPYERFLSHGAHTLTDAELLAIILRTGSRQLSSLELARKILSSSENTEGILGILHSSIEQLMEIPGIGQVKAIQIKCIAELSNRIARQPFKSNINFTSPKTIADYYMEDFRHKECEELHGFFLNSKYDLIRQVCLSRGTVNESFASPRELFIEALKSRSVYICLMHNHPSGYARPSNADITATKRIETAGKMIGISLIDHIIIGDNEYYSMKEHGYIR